MLLGFVISGALLAWVLRGVGLEGVRADLAGASLWPLALSVVFKSGGFMALSWRLTSLLRPVGGVPLSTSFRGQILGFAANNLVPLRLGELAKIDSVARQTGIHRATVLAAAATERLLDLFWLLALLVLVAPVALSKFNLPWIAGAGVITLATAIGAWWLASRPTALRRVFERIGEVTGFRAIARVGAFAHSFADGLEGLRSARVTVEALSATILYWGCSFCSITLWLRAFSLEAPWYAPAVVLVFLAFGTAIPASPGFVGTYEFFFLSALSVFGISAADATGMVMVGHALVIIPFTVLGALLAPGEILDVFRRFRADKSAGDAVA
jgi:uncharacterized protein (TIRG00374 family)